MVLVLSNDSPRDQWPLEHITKTIVGLDGRVRVLNVRSRRNGVKTFSAQVGSTRM